MLYEFLGIMNDKQDSLLDQLNILCLIWHALKIVSVGHFSTRRRKSMSQLFCLQMAFFANHGCTGFLYTDYCMHFLV